MDKWEYIKIYNDKMLEAKKTYSEKMSQCYIDYCNSVSNAKKGDLIIKESSSFETKMIIFESFCGGNVKSFNGEPRIGYCGKEIKNGKINYDNSDFITESGGSNLIKIIDYEKENINTIIATINQKIENEKNS